MRVVTSERAPSKEVSSLLALGHSRKRCIVESGSVQRGQVGFLKRATLLFVMILHSVSNRLLGAAHRLETGRNRSRLSVRAKALDERFATHQGPWSRRTRLLDPVVDYQEAMSLPLPECQKSQRSGCANFLSRWREVLSEIAWTWSWKVSLEMMRALMTNSQPRMEQR